MENAKAHQYFSDSSQIRLADSATEGDLEGMRAAIADGADVNKIGRQGITPLFWSLAKQQFQAFRLLLEHGADPNQMTQDEETRGYSSVLELAAAIPDSRYLKAALEHGGNPNLSTNEWKQPVIYQAIMHRNLDNVKLLVEHGAAINYQDNAHKTPMLQAVLTRQYTIALYLLRIGADPTIKDDHDDNVVDVLMLFGDRGIHLRTGDLEAYDEFVAELKRRGVLKGDPPRTR